MYKIVGQPEDYSDILARLFACNLIVGIVSVCYISTVSPFFKNLLDSFSFEISISGFQEVKALYVIVPAILAWLFLFFKLHDRISDFLFIRHEFDIKHILSPIVQNVGFSIHADITKKKRNLLMYTLFYKYAGFNKPLIDAQLVRTALDNWGWLWVLVEISCVLVITSICFLLTGHPGHAVVCLIATGVCTLFYKYEYKLCVNSAEAEVNAILSDTVHHNEILLSLQTLQDDSVYQC